MNILERIKRYLFGYDVFISYSRKDGLDYAYQLAEQLIGKGYECFIDQVRSFVPDKNIPPDIMRSLKRSTALVVVGSDGAATSKAVGKEIETFTKTRKNHPLVLVDVNGAIEKAIWFESVTGLARINESTESLAQGKPSDDIVTRAANAITFTKKSARLRYIGLGVLALTVLLTAVSVRQLVKVGKLGKDVAMKTQLLNDRQQQLNIANDSLLRVNKAQEQALARINTLNIDNERINLDNKRLEVKQSELRTENKAIAAQVKVGQELLADTRKEFNAVRTATDAMAETGRNPTRAVQLAMNSYSEKANSYASNVLLALFNSDNLFYKNIYNGIKDFTISGSGRTAIVMDSGRTLALSNNDKYSFTIIDSNHSFEKLHFVCNDSFIMAMTPYAVRMYERSGRFVREFDTDHYYTETIRYIKEKNLITSFGWNGFSIINLRDLTQQTIKLDATNSDTSSKIRNLLYSKVNDEFVIVQYNGSFSRFDRSGQFKQKSSFIGMEPDNLYGGNKVSISDVYSVTEGRRLLIHNNGKVFFYNYISHSRIQLSQDSLAGRPYEVNMSEQGDRFAITYLDRVCFYKISEDSISDFCYGDRTAEIRLKETAAEDVFFSPSGEQALLASDRGDLFLYNTTGPLIGLCKGYSKRTLYHTIKKAVWSNNSAELVTVGESDTRVWDLRTTRRKFFNDDAIRYSSVYAVDRNYNLIASIKRIGDRRFVIIRSIAGEVIDTFDTRCKIGETYETALDFSKDNSLLRLVRMKNEEKDTVYYNLKTKVLTSAQYNFDDIADFNPSVWQVKWTDNSFGNAWLAVADKSGAVLELPSKNASTWDRSDQKLTNNGTICARGEQAFEVFFLDIHKVIKKFSGYGFSPKAL